MQPQFPTVAAPAAYGCRYAGYSPDEWLAEVSGVPFGLPGQILGTNTDQAQVRHVGIDPSVLTTLLTIHYSTLVAWGISLAYVVAGQ